MTVHWTRHVDTIDTLFEPSDDWEFELTQLGCGPLGYRSFSSTVADITITREYITTPLRNRQMMRMDAFLAGVVLEGAQPVLWKGQEIRPGMMLIFGDIEHDLVLPANCVLQTIGASFQMADQFGLLALQPGLWHCKPSALAAFLKANDTILRMGNHPLVPPTCETPVADKIAAHRLLNLLLSALDQPAESAPTRQYSVMDRAEAYVSKHGWDEGRSMDELADAIAVPRRTMHRAFKTLYGMGPQGYLRLVRLHHFRNAMLRGEAQSVTDAALSAGFEHFGRAARYYREQFGELPRQTFSRIP